MKPAEMEALCVEAIQRAQPTVTLSFPPRFRFPAGFPRGELLSVNPAGARNRAIDPRQLLGWLLTLENLPPRTTP